MNFKEIKPQQLHSDCFTMIGKEWMLITAEKDGRVNTMTASWGGMGILWNQPVVFFFIRPQRYTKAFVDAATHISLTFFDEGWRKQLQYLGTVSGRDEAKIEKAGLHVCHHQNIPYFEDANTVIFAKKLYAQPMQETCFLQKELLTKNYPQMDLHTMYVAAIETIFSR